MKVAEMYLVCISCKRIPDWTNVTVDKNEKGQTVKKYEFEGLCPFCNGSKFEVIEVTEKTA